MARNVATTLVSGTAGAMAGLVQVRGQAPLSELTGYQNRLNALTAGQGRYPIAIAHYAAVPPAVQVQLTASWQARDED